VIRAPIGPAQEAIRETDEQVIEFEQALIALQVIPNIANPCMKKTMMVGPKKFVGKVPNPQIHQHSNIKKAHTDFDTFSLIQSSLTRAHSKAAPTAARSYLSGSSVAPKTADLKNQDVMSKSGAGILSENLETASFSSTGIISHQQNAHQSQILKPLPAESVSRFNRFQAGSKNPKQVLEFEYGQRESSTKRAKL